MTPSWKVTTVNGQMAHDRGVLDKTSFLSRYGHLRPGTYDILSRVMMRRLNYISIGVKNQLLLILLCPSRLPYRKCGNS